MDTEAEAETAAALNSIWKNHWAFLDEIDAPMWVDLTLESNSNYQDFNDQWFHTSHLFHQCSSRRLKAAFAHSGESSVSSDVVDGSSSNLPSSVSRSRGKHYAGKRPGANCQDFSLNKHPVKALSEKSLCGNTRFCEEIKPKLSFINPKGTSKSKISLVVQRNVTRNVKENHVKEMCSFGDSEGSFNTSVGEASESNASTITSDGNRSTITSLGARKKVSVNAKGRLKAMCSYGDSGGSLNSRVDKANESNPSTGACDSDQKRNLDVSNQAFGDSSRLVASLRNSFRKSSFIRPASRVDTGSGERLSGDSNPVSGKSSVGSSSNPSYGAKGPTFPLLKRREQTPDSRIETKMIRNTKSNLIDSYVSLASTVQANERACHSRRVGTSNAVKPVQKGASNSKVQISTVRAKALLPHRVNEQHLSTGAAKGKAPSRMVGAGIENMTGHALLNQKRITGDLASGVVGRSSKVTKNNVPLKDDKTISLKGKIGNPIKGKRSTSSTQGVFFR